MEFHTIKLEGRELKLYKTISTARCPEETQEEYKMRKAFVKQQLKDRRQKGVDYRYGN
jgi:hypothetical protein